MATADDIAKLKDRALADTAAAGSVAALEEVRVLHTGRRSELAQILASIGSLAPDERGVIGKAANIARREIEAALAERKATLEAAELTAQLANDRTDVTLPGDPYPRGALHLLTQVRLEIEEIFLALGYEIADGPEVETEHYNFTALNTPEGHPARSVLGHLLRRRDAGHDPPDPDLLGAGARHGGPHAAAVCHQPRGRLPARRRRRHP